MKIYRSNDYTCFEIDNWDASNWKPGKEHMDLLDMEAGIRFLLPVKFLGQLVFLTAHLLRKGGHKIETPEDLAEFLEK